MDLNDLATTRPNDAKRWYQQAAIAWFQEIAAALNNGWTRKEIADAIGLDKLQGHRLLRAYDRERADRDRRRVLRNRRIVAEYAELANIAAKDGIELPLPATLIKLDGE